MEREKIILKYYEILLKNLIENNWTLSKAEKWFFYIFGKNKKRIFWKMKINIIFLMTRVASS